MATLKLFAGSDANFALDFGDGYNLTGKTIVLIGKTTETQADDAAPIRVAQAVHVDPARGKSSLMIPGAQTVGLGGKNLIGYIQVRNAPAPAPPETIDQFVIDVRRAPVA